MWQLRIPSKVKIFMWRILHGIIPLKSIMVNRHVGTSGECPICHVAAEHILHLLFQCHKAREMWRLLGLDSIMEAASSIDWAGSVVVEYLLRSNNNTMPGFENIGLKETISVACWYLWWLRRCQTHDE